MLFAKCVAELDGCWRKKEKRWELMLLYITPVKSLQSEAAVSDNNLQ